MTKTENLFDLSNAELRERLKAEGIEYKDNDTKKVLVSRLNGDYKDKTQKPEDVEAEKATLDAVEEQEEVLSGLMGLDGDIELGDGVSVSKEEVLAGAFALFGGTVSEWNALSDLERWQYVTPFLDTKRAELDSAKENVEASKSELTELDAALEVIAAKDAEITALKLAVDAAQTLVNKQATLHGHIDDLPKIAQ